MARIRSIKHDFFLDEELAECEMAARILFAGLWVIADKAGRLADRPLTIKAQILPYDNVDADALLAQLAARKLIIRYRVGSKAYIQVRSFTRHQKPHPKEPESEILGPPDGEKAPQYQPESNDLPCVYFIQPEAGGLIKIGYARNVYFRLSDLQTGCPIRLRVLGIIPAARSREKEIHQQFNSARQDGEWFEPVENLLEFIKHEAVAVEFHGRQVKAVKDENQTDGPSGRNGSGGGLGDLGSSVNGGFGNSVNTHSDLRLMCVPKSKFSLEEIRKFAWASYRLDQKLTDGGSKVEGIRNPDGWAIVAHRSGEFDGIIQEWLDNPQHFEVAS